MSDAFEIYIPDTTRLGPAMSDCRVARPGVVDWGVNVYRHIWQSHVSCLGIVVSESEDGMVHMVVLTRPNGNRKGACEPMGPPASGQAIRTAACVVNR